MCGNSALDETIEAVVLRDAPNALAWRPRCAQLGYWFLLETLAFETSVVRTWRSCYHIQGRCELCTVHNIKSDTFHATLENALLSLEFVRDGEMSESGATEAMRSMLTMKS